MKTSNKLLLCFLAIVILALVSFDFIVVNESSKFNPKAEQKEQIIKLTDKAFKYVKINTVQSGWVLISIQQNSKYGLNVLNKNQDSIKFKILNDTLILTISGYKKGMGMSPVQISSPTLRSIISRGTIDIHLTGVSADTLSIFTSARSAVILDNNIFKYLEIVAQDSSEIGLNDNNKIDETSVKLKKGSHIYKP
jgi:hypothetical protein